MQVTREEAEKVADAICDGWPRERCTDWRAAMRRLVMRHLCPPPKLEWEYDDDYTIWRSQGYEISLDGSGLFGVCKVVDENCNAKWLTAEHPTLAEAKAAAQQHHEAQT